MCGGKSLVSGSMVINREIDWSGSEFYSVLPLWPWASGLKLEVAMGVIKQKKNFGDCFFPGLSRKQAYSKVYMLTLYQILQSHA